MVNRDTVTKEEGQLSQYELDLQRLANFRLMDDDFMSEVFDGNVDAVELLLKIILERIDMRVKRVKTQVEYKSATQRSIKLDIHAEDADKKVYDIEIQRSDHGSGIRRARFHSSMIDRTLLEKGQDFDSLVDTYVIFITENDKFKQGFPLYHIERTIREMDSALFGDGTHIIYVNGEFQDTEHPIGRLMHDFNCRNAEDMLIPLLAKEVRYFKETEGGQDQMCRMMEEMRNEAAEKAAHQAAHDRSLENAGKLIARGKMTLEEIAEDTGLTFDEVKQLAE